MKVIIIDENNAIIVKGWIWKKQAEVYKSHVYEGEPSFKYKLNDRWVLSECHDALLKAYGIKKIRKPPPRISTDPWVPVPKKPKSDKNTTLPAARLLTTRSK